MRLCQVTDVEPRARAAAAAATPLAAPARARRARRRSAPNSQEPWPRSQSQTLPEQFLVFGESGKKCTPASAPFRREVSENGRAKAAEPAKAAAGTPNLRGRGDPQKI